MYLNNIIRKMSQLPQPATKIRSNTFNESQLPKQSVFLQANLEKCINSFVLNLDSQLKKMVQSLLQPNLISNLPHTEKIESVKQTQLHISNKLTKYKLKHGEQFRDLMDPRDVVLEHTFDFKVEVNHEEILKNGFLESKTYQMILKKIKQFFVQTIANILSVSFRFLNDNRLKQKEAKNFVASNILLNITSIFTKTIEAIKDDKNGIEKTTNLLKQIQVDLVEKMQAFIRDILVNLASYYPQASPTGGTLRMNNVISEINRVDDEKNDLLYSNNITIEKYLQKVDKIKPNQKDQYEDVKPRSDGDYTDFIMEVVNTAIKVVQTSQNDSRERTTKEIFRQFCIQLFALSDDQEFKKKDFNSEQSKKIICQYFKKITQTHSQNEHKSHKKQSLQQHINQQPQNAENFQDLWSKMKLKHNHEHALEKLKGYSLNSKIPSQVKAFSMRQISDRNFQAKHSSILRILTKWAEYLKQIFDDPQQHIMKRLYPFKDIHNKLVVIDQQYLKRQLIENLQQQRIHVNKKLEEIKNRINSIVAEIIVTQNQQPIQNIYRFSNTRKTSSKINSVLTSLMVEYLSVLIHHLLKARKGSERDYFNQKTKQTNLNLVVFKVSDLLRAKFKCSESTFITLLKTIYILDQDLSMKNKFRLVRIKNKLQQPANNIMVNFMFMGKVVCELQLSVQESEGKEKNYFTFSHLVYQFIRGNFGIIPGISNMISQLDPIISSCGKSYFQQKKQSSSKKNKELKKKDLKNNNINEGQNINDLQIDDKANKKLRKTKQQKTEVYYCQNKKATGQKCRKLVINQNLQLFREQQYKENCLTCIFRRKDIVKEIKQIKQIKQIYPDHQLLKQLKLNNYAQISKKSMKRIDQNYSKSDRFELFLKVESSGKLSLVILIFVQIVAKFYIVRVTPQILTLLRKEKLIDQNKFLYTNITNQIQNKAQINDCFLLKVNNVKAALSSLGFKDEADKKTLLKFALQFSKYRIQKCLIKSIKFKTEIISCRFNKTNWECFENIVSIFSQENKNERQKLIEAKLRYKKYNQLQFSKIKKIQAQGCKMGSFFKGLMKILCNLKEVIFSSNNLNDFDGFEHLSKINKLNLSKNQLKNLSCFNIKHIKQLNLSKNKLQNIDGLQSLTTIDTLNLSYNQLSNVNGLKNIKGIKQLNLSNNKLREVDVLESLIFSLDTLNLKDNFVESFQFIIKIQASQSHLKILNLQNNLLKSIPDFSKFSLLSSLNIASNKVKQIPQFVANLKNLTQLNVSQNQIETLPKFLQKCQVLKIINFDNCPLKQIECIQFLQGFPQNQLTLYFTKRLTVQQSQPIKYSHQVKMNYNKDISQQLKGKYIATQKDLNELFLEAEEKYKQIQGLVLGIKQYCKINYVSNFIVRISNEVYQMQQIQIYYYSNDNQILKRLKSQHSNISIKEYCLSAIYLPRDDEALCWRCNNRLSFPHYWLPWQGSQNKNKPSNKAFFGCRQCVQEKCDFEQERNHFGYRNNSLLLPNERVLKILPEKAIGCNKQPQKIRKFQNNHKFMCKSCKNCDNFGEARYLCLVCHSIHWGENDKDGFVDMCSECIGGLFQGDKDTKAQLQKQGHNEQHPWLRILYQSQGGYFDY